MKFALIVDDSEFQRKHLMDILLKLKIFYKVIEVKDADAAMKMCMKFDPDLIFMDYDMPGIDGLTASEMIFQMKKDANIVMVTAKDRINLRKKAIDIGIKHVLSKPYTDIQIAKTALSFVPMKTQNNEPMRKKQNS